MVGKFRVIRIGGQVVFFQLDQGAGAVSHHDALKPEQGIPQIKGVHPFQHAVGQAARQIKDIGVPDQFCGPGFGICKGIDPVDLGFGDAVPQKGPGHGVIVEPVPGVVQPVPVCQAVDIAVTVGKGGDHDGVPRVKVVPKRLV